MGGEAPHDVKEIKILNEIEPSLSSTQNDKGSTGLDELLIEITVFSSVYDEEFRDFVKKHEICFGTSLTGEADLVPAGALYKIYKY